MTNLIYGNCLSKELIIHLIPIIKMYINDFPINYPLFVIDNFSYEYDEENILKDLEKKWFK